MLYFQKNYFVKNLKTKYRHIMRKRLNQKNRSALRNTDFSLISNNCSGGVLCHELGLRFNSPTVNMWMKDEDYLKFVSDLKHYITEDVREIHTDRPYPVGQIDDIELYFQHYPTFDDAVDKWKKRCQRINWANLYFLFVRMVDDEMDLSIQSFLKLPLKKKAVLTLVKNPVNSDVYYMSGSDGIEISKLGGLCAYRSKLSSKRYVDDFDYVTWLNKER